MSAELAPDLRRVRQGSPIQVKRERLEIEPLRSLLQRELERRGTEELLDVTRLTRDRLLKLLHERRSVSVFVVDELTVAFGMHPIEIYGDAWIEAAERDEALPPARKRIRSRRVE